MNRQAMKALSRMIYYLLLSFNLHSFSFANFAHEYKNPEESVALCLDIRDEPLDIVEWLEYHRSIGIDKVYLMDNNSTISMIDPVWKFIQSGFVDYDYVTIGHDEGDQRYMFQKCIDLYSQHHKYMGFLDVDEFIVIVDKSKSIFEIVNQYEEYGGLCMNWMLIGSNGHIKRPEGGVLQNYNQCKPNFHIKTIVNTKKVESANIHPHNFNYHSGYYTVDSNRNKVTAPYNPGREQNPDPSLFEVIYVNHYLLKSREDFMKKTIAGKWWDNGVRDWNFFEKIDNDINSADKICQNLFIYP